MQKEKKVLHFRFLAALVLFVSLNAVAGDNGDDASPQMVKDCVSEHFTHPPTEESNKKIERCLAAERRPYMSAPSDGSVPPPLEEPEIAVDQLRSIQSAPLDPAAGPPIRAVPPVRPGIRGNELPTSGSQ